MKTLNPKIKFLAIEAIAGSRYLLRSDDFPHHCLQIECDDKEDFPQDELLLIDRVTAFNAFREFTSDELNDSIRQKLINRLSDSSIAKIEMIFKGKLSPQYTEEQFKYLVEKHGEYGTWAIWPFYKSKQKEKDTSVIFQNYKDCHCRYVIVGLNVSKKIDQEKCLNFRGGVHDRKLKYSFNTTKIRGAYMTDLFKNKVEANSVEFRNQIIKDVEKIAEDVSLFNEELSDVGVNSNTVFLIMGKKNSAVSYFFKKYFKSYFPNNEVIYHRHYSSRGTDKEWVESIWNKLNIDADFDKTISMYH